MFTGKGSEKTNYPSFSGTVVDSGHYAEIWDVGYQSRSWSLKAFEIDENPMGVEPGTVLRNKDGLLVMYTGIGDLSKHRLHFSGVCLGYDKTSECVEQIYLPGYFSSTWFPENFKPYHKPIRLEHVAAVLDNIPCSDSELNTLAVLLCKDKKLTAKEESIFIAGFESAIQYLNSIRTSPKPDPLDTGMPPGPGLDYNDLGEKFDEALNEIGQDEIANWVDEDIDRLRKEELGPVVDEVAAVPAPELFLIMRGWMDPSEKKPDHGYEPYAFTTDQGLAEKYCKSRGHWFVKDMPNEVIPKSIYISIPDIKAMVKEFKPLMTYYCHHVPSGENWIVLGVNEKKNLVIPAGWPPSRAKLSDCIGFEERGVITQEEINYLNKEFGYKQKSPGEAQ